MSSGFLLVVAVALIPPAHIQAEAPVVGPFTIDVGAEVLDDLNRRLDATRWPALPTVDDWRYGVNSSYPTELVKHWRTQYDWRASGHDNAFVRPGGGSPDRMPVWGHRNGLRIGIKPTRGPAGLIRIYGPFLQQEFPIAVNFLSIEPSIKGQRGRGQSELESSRDRPGERGLTFWASNSLESRSRSDQPVSGVLDDSGATLRVFIHTERFANGALPVLECIFHRGRPFEVELVTHAAAGSATMESCVISATMGNYGLLREIHLKNNRVVSALGLWRGETRGELGFLPWRTWDASELDRTPDGRYFVKLSTDADDPTRVEHDPRVKPHWRYTGRKAIHYWRAESDAKPTVAVNGRETYWMSDAAIPGGVAFENFELRIPFESGRRLWFGVRPDR